MENSSSQLTRHATNGAKGPEGKQPEIDVVHRASPPTSFYAVAGTPVIPARDNEIRRWVDQWDAECKIDDRKDWGQPDAEVQNRQAEFPIGNVGQNLTLNSEGKYLYYVNLKKIKQ